MKRARLSKTTRDDDVGGARGSAGEMADTETTSDDGGGKEAGDCRQQVNSGEKRWSSGMWILVPRHLLHVSAVPPVHGWLDGDDSSANNELAH